MSRYLEEEGLEYFWGKIKQYVQGIQNTILAKVWPIANGGTGATNTSGAKTNLKAMGAVSKNGYYGLTGPNENDTAYIRSPQSGLIPYESNSDGSGQIGTSTWPFKDLYTKRINGRDPWTAGSYVITLTKKITSKVNSGSYHTENFSFTPSAGYKPVGFVSMTKSGTGASQLALVSYNMNGLGVGTQSTLAVGWRNIGSTAVAANAVTVNLQIACVKCS